jgi:hypothetical protein
MALHGAAGTLGAGIMHRCTLCGWFTDEPVQRIAEARSVWHVYRDHRDTWRVLAGSDRPPLDPDPDTVDGYAELAAITGTN